MKHICIACGHVDEPQKVTEGSFLGEAALLIIILVISAITGLWWLLLVVLFYSLFRTFNGKPACALCKSQQIIPVDSPNGKALLQAKEKA